MLQRRRDVVSSGQGQSQDAAKDEDEETKAQTRRRMNKEKEEAKNVPGAELAGYMPLRGEVSHKAVPEVHSLM